MDRQFRSRLVLYGTVAVMFALAALQPSTAAVFQASILVPAGFLAVAALLLAAPYIAMSRAEGRRIGWRRALDFLEHNSLVAFVDFALLWVTTGIVIMAWNDLSAVERMVFLAATAVGAYYGLRDWLLAQQSDRTQRRWQRHPQS